MSVSLQQSGWRQVEFRLVVTPLGIRFWDPALDAPVTDGLTVIAYPEGARRLARTAFLTAGGVYAFRDLPGLHDYEHPPGDTPAPASLPAQRRFVIEVNDADDRFLPVCFYLDAPIRGVFPQQTATSLGGTAPGFFLFSASTRATTPVLATVRAELRERIDATHDRPAAHALLEITTPDGVAIGLADARGAVAVLLPYPVFTVAPAGASSLIPSSTGPEQSWAVGVGVRYQPSAFSVPTGAVLPELRGVLAQAPGVIWTSRSAPPGQGVNALSETLLFGQELVLRTAGESVLLVGPGSMP